MGDEVKIKGVKYLYPYNPLWQIDLAIKRSNGQTEYQRLFVKPDELDKILNDAKEQSLKEAEEEKDYKPEYWWQKDKPFYIFLFTQKIQLL